MGIFSKLNVMNKAKILLVFLLTSCLSPFVDEDIHSVDHRLEYYYNSFVQDGLKRGVNIENQSVVLRIIDLEGERMGIHMGRYDNIAHVAIDVESYNLLNDDSTILKLLVYHELGHAFLNLDHVDNCSDIMNENILCVVRDFRIKEEQLIDELFLK